MHLIEYQDIENWENYDAEASYEQNVSNYVYAFKRSLNNIAIITVKDDYGGVGTNYYYKPVIK